MKKSYFVLTLALSFVTSMIVCNYFPDNVGLMMVSGILGISTMIAVGGYAITNWDNWK